MNPLHISEDEVARLVGVGDAISAVESVGSSMARGTVAFGPRTRLRMKNGFLNFMPASLEDEGYFGYKTYVTFKGTASYFVYLFDNRSGEMLAVIGADRLGQLRTGAASAVATKFLARREARTLGIIGSGFQAETQLAAITSVLKFDSVNVFSRHFEHAEKFCEKMRDAVGCAPNPVRDVREVAESDVVVTVTSALSPVLPGEMLKPGAHVNAVGGNMLIKRELDETAVGRADMIVIDNREQGKVECGDFLPVIEKGKLHWESVYEFQDLFNGKAARSDASSITLFKSQGIAPWDVALGRIVYERALDEKAGRRISL